MSSLGTQKEIRNSRESAEVVSRKEFPKEDEGFSFLTLVLSALNL